MSIDKNKEPGNFVGSLHNRSYKTVYESIMVDHSQFISGGGRFTESLNGVWQYGIDQYDSLLRAHWYKENYYNEKGYKFPMDFSFDQWERVTLPCSSNMISPELKLYEGSLIFTRTFTYKRNKDERLVLNIGAANYTCYVFINKEYLGMHKGGSTPFTIDITDKILKDNRIILCVDNTRRPEQLPCENTDWFNYGGVFRDISLMRLPKNYIKNYFVRLVADGKYDKIKVDVTVSGDVKEVNLEINKLGIEKKIPIDNGTGSATFAAEPIPWDLDNPKLYEVRLYTDEDEVVEDIGFRQIETRGNRVYLNGKMIYLKGISSHEESQANGRALTDEERIENIMLAKELGCNIMRLAHYPHSENMARFADRLGILLWEEIPVYWAIDFSDPATIEDGRNQLAELILRDRNRASVIIWSVGNENADTDERLEFMSGLSSLARALDESRLISAACMVNHGENKILDRLAEHLDIIGLNEYYGWYDPEFEGLQALLDNSNPDKPVFISEFGADARAGHRGTVNDQFTEDMAADIYQKQVTVLRNVPYICGMSPWILYDFRCPRRLHYLQGYYNLKGLCSSDKKYKKLPFYVLQDFYSQIDNDPRGEE